MTLLLVVLGVLVLGVGLGRRARARKKFLEPRLTELRRLLKKIA
jgi:hypothetical protein